MPSGETTIFVYDARGRLIGEYSTEVQATQDAKTQYLTADHLGTPRINTNAVGAVVSRSDYMPYGEEIVGLGGRTSGQGYVADDVRQGFTGYERDGETGLDFAQARYYSNSLGRYSTVDPLMASADITTPQTFNRYIYVGNNPVNVVDPTGLAWGALNGNITWYDTRKELIAAGATEVFVGVSTITGQLYALNPRSSVPVAVASAEVALEKLLTWRIAPAAVTASAAALGVSAALLAVIMGTYIAGNAGTLDGRPEPVKGLSMSKQNFDYWWDLGQEMNKLKMQAQTESAAPSASSESSPADPNSVKPDPDDNKPTYEGSSKHHENAPSGVGKSPNERTSSTGSVRTGR